MIKIMRRYLKCFCRFSHLSRSVKILKDCTSADSSSQVVVN